MKTSEAQDKLVPALFAARKLFPRIAKDKRGQAGNRSFNYAPLDAIKDQIDPVLFAQGLMITDSTDGHELVTRLEHESGQWRESRMPVNAEHANMQSYGIELTYRRRYQYQLILGILTEEDTDIKERNRKTGKDFTEDKNANGTSKAGGAISAAKEAARAIAAHLSDERKRALEEAALTMIDAYTNGNGMSALKVWREVSQADQEEGVYLWDQIGCNSKLRSFIKANKTEAPNA